MIIEVSKAEKELLEHALLRLSLSTKPVDEPFLKDVDKLWTKLYFIRQELEPVPEYFLLEECDNV